MIQIRSSQWETNSSSCHVFVFDKNTDVNIPSVLELKIETTDTPLNIYFNDVYVWYDCDPKGFEEDMADFINLMFTLGVGTIKCKDDRIEKLAQAIKDGTYDGYYRKYNSDNKAKALFSPSTKVITLCDNAGLIFSEEVKRRFGEDKDYFSLRLS